MYKIVVTDLDETLLNDEHQISEKDIETIKKMTQMGIKVVVATGRGFNTCRATLQDMGLLDLDEQYIISFNGGIISEVKTDRILDRNCLDFPLASWLYHKGFEEGLCTHVYTITNTYIYNYVVEERDYVGGRMFIDEYFDDNIDFLRDTPITKCLFMDLNLDNLYRLEKVIKEEIGDQVEYSYSSNRYLEFNPPHINKGVALVKLAKLLGVDIKDTIAVGDNVNDLSMIKSAGLGIGVHNCNKAIVNDCDVVLTSSNNENPMTEIYERFILNQV